MELKSITELKQVGASFEEIVVPNGVHTVEDVELACQCTKVEVIKTLLFVGLKPILVLVTGDRKVNLQKLKTIFNDDSLRMASKNEVSNITGFNVGSVSPFGLRKSIEIIADQDVQNLTSLILGSGKDDTLLKISQLDFVHAFKGKFVPLAL